jgi:hypothetical protein
MSCRCSRLSTLTLLALLYVSPLSTGDTGLWLSVTSMPIQVFGAIPSRMPPEHSILLPDRSGLALDTERIERIGPVQDVALFAADDATAPERWEPVVDAPLWDARDELCLTTTAPRGPPAWRSALPAPAPSLGETEPAGTVVRSVRSCRPGET